MECFCFPLTSDFIWHFLNFRLHIHNLHTCIHMPISIYLCNFWDYAYIIYILLYIYVPSSLYILRLHIHNLHTFIHIPTIIYLHFFRLHIHNLHTFIHIPTIIYLFTRFKITHTYFYTYIYHYLSVYTFLRLHIHNLHTFIHIYLPSSIPSLKKKKKDYTYIIYILLYIYTYLRLSLLLKK